MAKVNVIILIGVAGSGKSTFAKDVMKKTDKNTRTFSSDTYRQEMYGSLEEGNKHNTEVFENMNKDFLDEIVRCNDIKGESLLIYDATNLNRRKRRFLYREILKLKCDTMVLSVVVFASLQRLLENNRNREEYKQVPEEVIMRMYKSFEIPRVDVDCDMIGMAGEKFFSRTVDYANTDISVLKRLMASTENLDFLLELQRISASHNNPHHLESIPEHIDMCIKNSVTDKEKKIAFFHDLGKSLCKETGEDGISRYYSHSNVSAYYYLNYMFSSKGYTHDFHNLDIIEDYPYAKEQLEVAEVIHQHMVAHQGIGFKNKRNNLLTGDLLSDIINFMRIDDISRIKDLDNI